MTKPQTGSQPATQFQYSRDRIPLRPTTPELIQREKDLLAELQERIEVLEQDGWVVTAVSTSESISTGTYIRWYSLTKDRRA